MPKMLRALFAIALALVLVTPALSQIVLKDLTAEQKIASFETEAVYLNQDGKRIGARFSHIPSQFVLDILRIQSLPQAFMWVNTPPPSDQGEPHTLEHLLLGKGTKGRYVASLEDMSLGNSSAFTQQIRTCYHFNTSAGSETFFNLFEAKLDAMIHPNYSDEEIRREVRNMGVAVNNENGSKYLEEKGTVYNEMVSSFERPWGNLYFNLLKNVYGDGHPLSYSAGGLPSAIRTMQPEDIRNFREAYYHLNNMGAVVSIGDEITLVECLGRLSEIFDRIEPNSKAGSNPAEFAASLPKASPQAQGKIATVGFPHSNENEPGLLVYAWPAERNMSLKEYLLFNLFVENLSSGQTSNLYKRFIDSQTRLLDIGASSSFGWISDHPGQALFIGFSNVSRDATSEKMIDSVRSVLLGEIEIISSFADNSPELLEFNERLRSLSINNKREIKEFLNSPPRFGYRGTGSRWFDHLQLLKDEKGFERDVSGQAAFAFVDQMLDSKKNFWQQYITKWKLLSTTPFGIATHADPELLTESENSREKRIGDYVAELQKKYKADSKEAAIEIYEKEYAKNTEIIDAEAATIEMPPFVENPPLTLDDQLNYTVEKLPGGGDCVYSLFDNISSTTVGLVFDLYSVPESLLVYLPVLPTVMTQIGVVKEGQTISFDEMNQAIKRDILGLDAYFSTGNRTERVGLTLVAAGSDKAETEKALNWLSTALFSPNLSEANLPRIRDAVDLRLKSLRNRMRGSEESWVNEPMYAYWRQHNLLFLSARCFLTQAHLVHRIRWMLKSAGDQDQFIFFEKFMGLLSDDLAQGNREQVQSILKSLASTDNKTEPMQPLLIMLNSAPEEAKQLLADAVKDLTQSLSDIPDNSLSDDLTYLCSQMTADLKTSPAEALGSLNHLLDIIRHQDNVRAYIVSNEENKKIAMHKLTDIVSRLAVGETEKYSYNSLPLINDRLSERTPLSSKPICIGLVNENTRSGVHNNTSNCASYEETDEETLLKFLSARLYGGGGAHSMFMKTWGAGLAYSNGLRSNENDGRLVYYAERCPDLAQTMQFVIDQLENAPYDPSLADYAVSQAFTGIRSGSTYDSRGEAMAADLADGLTPDVVKRFRSSILNLRKSDDLYDKLHKRMASTYGEVLPGYGPTTREANQKSNAIIFVIGPEKQLTSYEQYLRNVEDDVTLHRIYPRDFWIVAD